ncbi:MAG: SDR family oxidoreductase [Pseudomonadota bacterium]
MALFITGGTRGIGLEIAKAFSAPGETVFVNYRSDEETASEAVAEIEALGGRAVALKGDCGTPAGCAALADAVRASGVARIDQVVHCAVDAYATSCLEADPEAFSKAVTTNGTALLFLVQSFLPLMDRGSTVFFLSSRGGRIVVPNYAAIGVAKALAESLVRYLSAELAPKGIRINCVAPSLVDTAAVRTVFGDQAEDLVKHAGETNPTGRAIEARDYTSLIRWLASPEAEFIQGQVVYVNGGHNVMG